MFQPQQTYVFQLTVKVCLLIYLFVKRVVIEENQRLEADRPPVDLQSLSTRAYLDYTVVPILMDAMTAVAKERYCLQIHAYNFFTLLLFI